MASFCRQCSEKTFHQPDPDMIGLCNEGFVIAVLCEECGPIEVDHTGKCVSVGCLERHNDTSGD